MKFTRLLLYLFLVSVFGFLNAFMTQNYGQKGQAGETDKLNDVFRNELVGLTHTAPADDPGIKL